MNESERVVIPVRRLHNYVYCPRLMYFQFVEGIFVDNPDTVAGRRTHNRVDMPMPVQYPDELLDGSRETVRSLAMEDDELGISGVADLLRRQDDGSWRIYDYKHGAPMTGGDGRPVPKEADAAQVVAYAFMAYKKGFHVTSGAVYYAQTRQLVEVGIPDTYDSLARLVEDARRCASGPMPQPLKDDARCLYCSMYPVCLPNETLYWKRQARKTECSRPPVAEGGNGACLVVTSPKAYISKRGDTIVVAEDGQAVASSPVHDTSSIAIYGGAQISTPAMLMCMKEGIAVSFFSPSGSYVGRLDTLCVAGLDSRRGQYRLAENEQHAVKVASMMLKAKIANQRTLMLRNCRHRDRAATDEMTRLMNAAVKSRTRAELMGTEGMAAALYFSNFPDMLANAEFASLFSGRNRRPPPDPVNAMLSLGYSVLSSELAGICHMVGLDPACGLLHAPRYGRPALALDLMEEFRPLIVDSVVLSLVNRRAVDMNDFVFASTGCSLRKSGHQAFWNAYARRMNEELIHPTFKYRMSYRRLMEIQARQLWRIFRGDLNVYHPIITR